eukprot:gb/GECG01007793.1/.p1 GENE.gb/GECG01007793.1/~~gb/GECG01007793.1/.p1  ORF type:complete len:529 (+),score=80.52 gb/GECG01007793.1/:1-1587(+)
MSSHEPSVHHMGGSACSQSSTVYTFGSSATSATSVEDNGQHSQHQEAAEASSASTGKGKDGKKTKNRSKKSRGGKKRRQVKVVGEDMANYTATGPTPPRTVAPPRPYGYFYNQYGSSMQPPMPPQQYPGQHYGNQSVNMFPRAPAPPATQRLQPPLPSQPPMPPTQPPRQPNSAQGYSSLPQVISPSNTPYYSQQKDNPWGVRSSQQQFPHGMVHAASSHDRPQSQMPMAEQHLTHRSYSSEQPPMSKHAQVYRRQHEFDPNDASKWLTYQSTYPVSSSAYTQEQEGKGQIQNAFHQSSNSAYAGDPNFSKQRSIGSPNWDPAASWGCSHSEFRSTMVSADVNDQDDAASDSTSGLVVGDEESDTFPRLLTADVDEATKLAATENDEHGYDDETNAFYSSFVVFSSSLDADEPEESGYSGREQECSSHGMSSLQQSESYFEDSISARLAATDLGEASEKETTPSQNGNEKTLGSEQEFSYGSAGVSDPAVPRMFQAPWESSMHPASGLFGDNMASLANMAQRDEDDYE